MCAGEHACEKLTPQRFRLTGLEVSASDLDVRVSRSKAPNQHRSVTGRNLFATIRAVAADGTPGKAAYTARLVGRPTIMLQRAPNQYAQLHMPVIVRLDRFDAEPCLGDMGEDRHPPLFRNSPTTTCPDWTAAGGCPLGTYLHNWNLRWCSCKR